MGGHGVPNKGKNMTVGVISQQKDVLHHITDQK